jgi:CubicO group peptidase (beta-lactamase class C family)
MFEIASVTKLFTAQAIMLLVEDGLLRLEDEIGRILPDLPAAWQTITIENCLRHQSGIPSYTQPDAYWQQTRVDKTHAQIFSLVSDLPLNFAAGQRYSYDNTGFYLLGMVIEQVSQLAYGDFLQKRIFAPLNMVNTRTNDYAAIIPHRAAGYELANNQQSTENSQQSTSDSSFVNKPFYSTSNTFSAGNIVSSGRELALWAAGWQGLLSAESVAAMWTKRISPEADERDMGFVIGLGWFFVEHGGHRFAGHNGGIVGFSSSYCHFLDDDTVIIVLANGPVANPHEIAVAVKNAL